MLGPAAAAVSLLFRLAFKREAEETALHVGVVFATCVSRS